MQLNTTPSILNNISHATKVIEITERAKCETRPWLLAALRSNARAQRTLARAAVSYGAMILIQREADV